jgi:cob(I)alamin adenosyltransferase
VATLYTGKGDDGTTGLLFGGRVPKDAAQPRACGAVDEAQATMGVARALCRDDSESGRRLEHQLVQVMRDLWVLMGELAALPEHHDKLTDGQTRVTREMVAGLEAFIEDVGSRFEPPTEFVVPGQTLLAAQLDVARTVVRRAEREVMSAVVPGSQALVYLNRLSSLLWAQARWIEGESLLTRDVDAGT